MGKGFQMAINIVNRVPSPKVLKFVVCHECGVELSYVPKDVKEEKHYDYGGGCDMFYYIPCANCSEKVGVR